MNRVYFLLVAMSIICGCESRYTYRKLSSYNIDTTSLKDSDTIKILYCSGGPDDNSDRTYFYHLVVVNVNKASDTVNVLVPDISSLSEDNNVKIFSTANNEINLLLTELKKQNEANDISHMSTTDINRVIVNKDFDSEMNNNYPTVIGLLAEYDLSKLSEGVRMNIPPYMQNN